MDIKENPFHILLASPRDNRRRIMELADERSLQLDQSECVQARLTLITPRKRLSAEAAWLPGIAPKRTAEVLSLLEYSPADLIGIIDLNPIARANVLATGLARLPRYTPDKVVKWTLELARAFEDVDPKDLCAIINEERVVSGFPDVTDLSALEMEIEERRLHYRQVIEDALENLSEKEHTEAMTVAVESATGNGDEHGPILIADLVKSYEVNNQVLLEKKQENIETLAEKLRAAVDAERPDPILAPMVSQLIQAVKDWDAVAQPIQVSTKGLGQDHQASRQVAGLVRGLAVHMYNKHGKLEFSQQLTNMLKAVFEEVVEVVELVTQDADALGEIAEQHARLIAGAKNRAEEWRREITYEADVGAIFKNKLRISPEGIEWKGRCWDLDSITRVRWGGTRHSVNGIPTGTTYTIIFGSSSNYISIVLKKEAIYSNFIDRLWRAVGVRLLTKYLEGLRDGKQYQFGSAIMSDYGMSLERKSLFSRNKRVFCPWSELVIESEAGVFHVYKQEDRKVAAAFSYQDEDNIHILEAALRMFWKRGGNGLSSLLG